MNSPLSVAAFSFVALLLTANFGHAEDSLYQVAPENWLAEVIPAPLDFAPTIPLTGVEELRFAPEMMDPQAEEFFTYTFLWTFDDEATLTADSLRTYLRAYYEGLYHAVSKEGGADTELFKVEIDPAAEFATPARLTHTGRVHWVEPFRTEAPQTLNFQVTLWECSDAKTQLAFFHVSPLPREHPLWVEMAIQRAGECEVSER